MKIRFISKLKLMICIGFGIVLSCTTTKSITNQSNEIPHQLHDIWAVTSVYNNLIQSSEVHPWIEIHLNKHKILGFDGCNEFSADIAILTQQKIQIGEIRSTVNQCATTELAGQFKKAFVSVSSYKLNNLNLTFYDENQKELMKFKKVD